MNVIDTAVNYRHQRSERAIRTALATTIGRGVVGRDEVVVATKGGFIPFDGAVPRDPRGYFSATYLETGIIKPGDVARGAHCMTPRYLRDQIDRSRTNLGLETLDIYYLHNPETQLGEVDRVEFERRLRAAFEALERQCPTAASRATAPRPGPGSARTRPPSTTCPSPSSSRSRARWAAGPSLRSHPAALQPRDARSVHARQPAREGSHRAGARGGPPARRLRDGFRASVHQGQLTQNLPPLITEYIPGLTMRRAAGAPVRALDARYRHGARRHEVGRPRRGEREGRRGAADGVGGVPAALQRGRRLVAVLSAAITGDRKTLRRRSGSG